MTLLKDGITDRNTAQYHMPEGQSADVMRYWFPAHGKGPVNSDLIVLLRTGKNPVLGHLFLDFLLDYDVAVENMRQEFKAGA